MLNKSRIKALFDSMVFWTWKISGNKYLCLFLLLLPVLALLFGACNRDDGGPNRRAHP